MYQDLFGEGTFTGKGLIHVQAAAEVLGHRLPDHQVLSHDLLEGALMRCAGLSEVSFVEEAPMHADVAASRLHRWTRGDWQLLPLMPVLVRERPSRHQPVEDARQPAPLDRGTGLGPAAAVGELDAGRGLAHGGLGRAGRLWRGPDARGAGRPGTQPRPHRTAPLLPRGAGRHAARGRHAAVAPRDAARPGLPVYTDAIVRATVRQMGHPAAVAGVDHGRHGAIPCRDRTVAGLLRQHAPAVALAAAAGMATFAAIASNRSPAPTAGWVVLVIAWLCTPVWVKLASMPRSRPRRERLRPDHARYLRDLSRDTWRLYERHVGAEDHHLPPDNVQLVPHLMVAHRTSPTNIGMYLLAVACARELGFIGRTEMAEKIAATLDTLDRLPTHLGHFYNWYDTRTLEVLPPAYVSTVDSGNCSGHLLALAQACDQAAQQGAMARTLAACERALTHSRQRLQPLLPVLKAAPGLHTLVRLIRDVPPWPSLPEDRLALHRDIDRARQEFVALGLRPGADEGGTLQMLSDHVQTLDSVLRDLEADALAVSEHLRSLALRARAMALAPDYRMLYDPTRRLLHIGLRCDTGELDRNHYDLLASESRLTSLVAIAKGDVPPQHWAALGRPFFARGTQAGLKSWSGSMFEYLMPSLVLDEPPDSVLGQATRVAVQEQREEALRHGTPWGISESAIAAQDHTLAYQYGPQGAPRLALRRTPAGERVLAPYASAMATLVAPTLAVENLQAFERLGLRRALGFMEALDYTPQRQVAGTEVTEVNTFMAHHQAMSLVAFDRRADAGRATPMGHGRPAPARRHQPAARARSRGKCRDWKTPPRCPTCMAPARRSCGWSSLRPCGRCPPRRCSATAATPCWVNARGAGTSRWRGVSVTRWRDDALRDAQGTFLYLEHGARAQRHSLTAFPAADPVARYETRFLPDRAVFDATLAGPSCPHQRLGERRGRLRAAAGAADEHQHPAADADAQPR